jgi:hypothetical protein
MHDNEIVYVQRKSLPQRKTLTRETILITSVDMQRLSLH